MSGQGVRWIGGALVALGLLAVAGRLGDGAIGPAIVVTRATAPSPPPTTRAVPVARTPEALPEAPVRAALARGVLWVAGRQAVYRVAAGERARAVTMPRPDRGTVLDVTAGRDGVWLAVDDPGSVWHLDPAGGVTARIPTGRALTGTVRIAATRDRRGDEVVWVACCGRQGGAVLQLDPAATRVAREIPMPNGPTALAADRRGAMVTTELNELVEIQEAPDEPHAVLRISPGSLLRDVTLTAEAAWLAVPGRGLVLRLDRSDGELRSFRLPGGVSTLAAGRSGVWALSRDGSAVTPIGRGAQPPFALIPTGDRPARQLLAGRNALWLIPEGGAGVTRLNFPQNPELGRV